MANNSNTQIVNGYAFKLVNGKVVPDTKANLKTIPVLTSTTKKVAMEMGKVSSKEEGISL